MIGYYDEGQGAMVLDMVMFLRKQLVVVYCPYPKTLGRKGKGGRWPIKILWHFGDHVDRFGRPPAAFVLIK